MPKAILEAPVPEDGYQADLIRAFERLSTCRQIVPGGVGPIPWSAIHTYAQQLGITDDEILYEDFVVIIQEMDELFLKRKYEELEQERKKQRGKPGGVHSQPVRARPRR